MASLLIAAGPFAVQHAFAAQIQLRSITISDNQAQHTGVTYNTRFFIPTAGTLGSIEITFCDNSPLEDDVCNAPAGFDISHAALNTQSGQTGFSVSGTSTANDLVLTRPPAGNGIGMANYVLTGVKNPDTGGPLFARIFLRSTSAGTGPYDNFGGLALSILGLLSINLEVPPYLIFCIGENITGTDCTTATEPFSDLGDLSSGVTRAAQHQFLVATNAQNGYSVFASGGTMSSGNNTIHAMAAPGPSLKGASQFGMNLAANTNPAIGQDPQGPGIGAATSNYNQQNRFYFNSGERIAGSATSDNYRKYTVSYVVNVPPDQPGGVYSTTLTYTGLANF
ncbi:MAG TPA: hypothetical protein VLF71_00070 [Candidatus Saccharimonadales bacterium]|nr:hypothetical protein [Candidatus Saccharimonadales bacterium]